MSTPVDAALVEDAAQRLGGVVARTPLEPLPRLSARIGGSVWVKREDLQVVRSYKVRGAYNVIAQLDAAARARGVVCASAGNHGQGLAYACAALGVQGRIYLPRNTPRQKRDRINAVGGDAVDIVVVGDTYDEAAYAAVDHARSSGATLVPAFDDPATIAGQGTVAMEIVEQLGQPPDVLIVPVGGGGLLAGCVAWLGERHPGVRVIGVEPAGAANVAAALAAGHPVDLEDLDTFIDGAAVRRAGELTTPLIAASGAELVTVAEGRVCVEMLDMYQSEGIIAEPAGALATAVLGEVAGIEAGATVVCILSGGNNDVSRYAEIVERALVYTGLQALLPGGVRAGARGAAPLPRRGAGPRRRHHPLRVRQAQQPRHRSGPGGHRAGPGRRPRPPAEADGGRAAADRGDPVRQSDVPLPGLKRWGPWSAYRSPGARRRACTRVSSGTVKPRCGSSTGSTTQICDGR